MSATMDRRPYATKDSPALVSAEAEQSVLGGLMIDNGAIDRIGDVLKAEHFHEPEHRRIFTAIAGELFAGRPADVVTVFQVLQAQGHDTQIGYLNALAQSIPSASNIRRYAGIVIERAKARALMQVGVQAVEIAQDGAKPIDERIELMQGVIGKLSDEAAQREAVPLYEAMLRNTAAMSERAEGGIRAFPTGLRDLDDRLGGGIRPGNLVIMAARPSMGKTAMALTAALSMSQTYGVGFLSMEMSEAELSDRATAALGHVDMRHVQRPDPANDVMWGRVLEATEAAKDRGLWIDDQGALTIHQVSAKARAMRRKHGIDVLIVDYIQLMSGTDSKTPRAYQLEEITRGLKTLAKSLGIAVLALAQVNRKVEGGMPGLADLKDSGALEQDADIVAFIHRPIQVDPDLGEDWRYFAKVRVAKNRQGPTGDVSLSYIGHETRFAGWSGADPVKPQAKTAKRGYEE